jgi:ergothioneine biosynthesis protein EgtB
MAVARAAHHARNADRAALEQLLLDARARTLRLFAAYETALGPALRVPCQPELNLPLWELGHVGWFADWWITRNPDRERGAQADPDLPRTQPHQAARGAEADSFYNSSTVAHDRRWQLPLPNAAATRDHLEASLADTLALLQTAAEDDDGLYFFRLVLFHEDMHAEAAVYMAQSLGFDPGEILDAPEHRGAPGPQAATVPATRWVLGHDAPGFAFDNERSAHSVPMPAFEIDTEAVRWARFLPFVEQGGYRDRAFWSDAGWRWLTETGVGAPRYLRHSAEGWQQQRWGVWQPPDAQAAACYLTAFEAEAWCAWAGRRLPTEAEWECAAHTTPDWSWGEVWEWTASAFAPYPGFVAHPYVDYSRPWFDGRPVLKGASAATMLRMRHPKYRNYFTPERNDMMAGFRSAARHQPLTNSTATAVP